MSEITRFNTDVQKNAEMQAAVKKIGSDVAKIVTYANSMGYKFTEADLKAAAPKQGELSDKQLENVAGGVVVLAAVVIG